MDPESDALIQNQSNFRSIAGVVEQGELQRLRRLIFRATKGKSYVYTEEVDEDEQTVQKGKKSVYIITFWAGETVTERITKIVDSFQGERYEVP